MSKYINNSYLKHLFFVSGISFILLLPLIIYSWLSFLRPPQTNTQKKLFKGIAYQRHFGLTARPAIVHIVTIDLSTPGVKVLVTPPQDDGKNNTTTARTTSQFVREFKLQLAVNANFFHPFHENTPWDYYPHSGDVTSVLGKAISNGKHYSQADKKWGVLCISPQNRAQILDNGSCPKNTLQAVAGNDTFIIDGKTVNSHSDKSKAYARVAVASNKEGNILWLIVVDGKQPLYSEGATIRELASIASQLGAYTALNLDGGGSTTLVMAKNNKAKLLNAPIHTKLPMRERAVANHLGFYADKL